MKRTEDIGTVVRYLPDSNYEAVWKNNMTVRLGIGRLKELPPEQSEFYDISLGTWCNNNCSFCYTSAKKDGVFYENPCETWLKWSKTWYRRKIAGLTVTNAPFQVAIGSGGSSEEHPDFPEFLKTVRSTGVIPNYTTAGRILGYAGNNQEMIQRRKSLIDATVKYCSAIAVSLGNKDMRPSAFRAIETMLPLDIYVTLHHIISDRASVDEFLKIRKKYYPKVHYNVLLPLVHAGRSDSGMDPSVFEYLRDCLLDIKKKDGSLKDIAFGAKFIKYLETDRSLGVTIFPEQTYSKNILLKPGEVVITPSSFDLKPIKTIKL